MLNLTCPHCGTRFTWDDDAMPVERVDINGEPAFFVALEPGQERHIDMRLACPNCYMRAGEWRITGVAADKDDPPHPYTYRFHKLVRLDHPVGQK